MPQRWEMGPGWQEVAAAPVMPPLPLVLSAQGDAPHLHPPPVGPTGWGPGRAPDPRRRDPWSMAEGRAGDAHHSGYGGDPTPSPHRGQGPDGMNYNGLAKCF